MSRTPGDQAGRASPAAGECTCAKGERPPARSRARAAARRTHRIMAIVTARLHAIIEIPPVNRTSDARTVRATAAVRRVFWSALVLAIALAGLKAIHLGRPS